MNVSLTPELEQLVHGKVASGRYGSASEVVREALRLMEERDQERSLRRDEMRRQITVGVASLKDGRVVDGETFFDAVEADLEARERK